MLVKVLVIVCSILVVSSLFSVIACIKISGRADELERKIRENVNKNKK